MKNISYILAVLTLITAMSILPSCKKENPYTPKENVEDNLNGKPGYEVSFGEKVLLAAAPTHEINGYSESETEVSFLFASPFHVDSLKKDLTSISVRKARIASLEDNKTAVKVTFTDNKTATLKYQNEVAIIIDGLESNSIKDYPGSVKVYEYAVSKLGHGNVTVTASADGNISVENNFNKEEKKGKLTFTFPDEEKQNGIVNLSITDGINSNKIEIETASYFFNVEGSPVTLGATLTATAELNLTIDTDIPDVAIAITPAENAFFSVEGETVSVTSENHTGENRISYVEVSEVSGKMKSYKIEVTQESAPARDDIVIFYDANFKKVMLEIADKDNDGEVDFEEALQVKEINIANRNIVSLQGLEHFKNVEKIDAMNNDIKDANVLSELHFLHWLELRGNKNLVSIDFTGCCFYFDWCQFDYDNPELRYKQYKWQIGICKVVPGECSGWYEPTDLTGEHGVFITDERQTTDWSHQNNRITLQTHTKGNGKNIIILTGTGYIDEDIKNGTFERIMKDAYNYLFTCEEIIADYKEYFDVYYMERIQEKHHMYLGDKIAHENAKLELYKTAYNVGVGREDAYFNATWDDYNIMIWELNMEHYYVNDRSVAGNDVKFQSWKKLYVTTLFAYGKEGTRWGDNATAYAMNVTLTRLYAIDKIYPGHNNEYYQHFIDEVMNSGVN